MRRGEFITFALGLFIGAMTVIWICEWVRQ